ncbi:MAG: hypothetical protein GY716_00965 [bacterium]|nr:hypothetical protein [bacterium]
MATKMHRLQISLRHEQARFLEARAQLDGVSMAEVVRRLIDREVGSGLSPGNAESLWDIAGIAEDRAPLIDDVAVSENPELYLTGAPTDSRRKSRSTRRKRRP